MVHLQRVTHLSTNPARRRVTSLVLSMMLPLRKTANYNLTAVYSQNLHFNCKRKVLLYCNYPMLKNITAIKRKRNKLHRSTFTWVVRAVKIQTFFLLGLCGVTWSSSSAILGGSFHRHVKIFWTRPLIGAHCNPSNQSIFSIAEPPLFTYSLTTCCHWA